MKKSLSIVVLPLALLSAGPVLAESLCVIEGDRAKWSWPSDGPFIRL